MPTLRLRYLLLPVLFAIGSTISAQESKVSDSGIGIESVRRDTRISVRIELKNNSKTRVYIPFAGEHDGERFASVLAVRIEEKGVRVWKPVKQDSNRALLGGERLGRCIEVEGGQSIQLLYQFDPTRYSLKRGAHLRLVFSAWSSDSAVGSTPPDQNLTSPEFELP